MQCLETVEYGCFDSGFTATWEINCDILRLEVRVFDKIVKLEKRLKVSRCEETNKGDNEMKITR